jgi:hypothetical protein
MESDNVLRIDWRRERKFMVQWFIASEWVDEKKRIYFVKEGKTKKMSIDTVISTYRARGQKKRASRVKANSINV